MIRIDIIFDEQATRVRIMRVPGTVREYTVTNASLSRVFRRCADAGSPAHPIDHNHLRAVIRR